MKKLDLFLQRWRIMEATRFIQDGDRILDIGTADGAIFKLIQKKISGVGIDPCIEAAGEYGGYSLIKGFFPQNLKENRPFDVITLLAVLEHFPNEALPELVANISRLLAPGGRLIITVPSALVDHILWVLRALKLIDGMALEEHHGFDPKTTPTLFSSANLNLFHSSKFQLGLNNLFVFKKQN